MGSVWLAALLSFGALVRYLMRQHHMGDLMVLRTNTSNKRAALIKVSLAGAVTAPGGMLGYWLVEQLHSLLPDFLVVASSSFIYVDWPATGIVLVALMSGPAHE